LLKTNDLPATTVADLRNTQGNRGKKMLDIPLLCLEAQNIAQLTTMGLAGRL
jgi:hypothetical protein